MKVVYEKTVEEKVKDAISKAELEGRKIEKIVLSRKDLRSFTILVTLAALVVGGAQ